ncbi:F-box protein At4g00755-like [Silene latifolia]|uniref:F-box protein At4g00755-like n=1 Tax=Silene latifolia TaxID=37657 RepID=UPI003D787E57
MNHIDWNFLDSLPPDVSFKILTCLDDPGDIVRASSVSRIWRDFVIANGMCKRLFLKKFPQLSGIADVVDTSKTQQESADIGSSRSAELEQLKKEHRAFASLARGLATLDVDECLADALSASSTDNYPEEGIHNTLEPRDQIGDRASYWSSSGQSNPEVPERLTYELFSDFCVVTEINVQPFQAFFQENSPIYSAKAVRFRMGYRKWHDEEEEVDFSKDNDGHSFTDKHFVWTYTSQEFPMAQENRLQNFKLPDPVLCIGGIIQIELLGRVQKQEMDGMFYTCVAHVQVLGRLLSPVFSVNPLEPPGRFILMFNPQAEFYKPRNIHEESSEINVTPNMMQRHVGGWEQIFNMLRGTPWVEVYDSEDEQHDSDEDMVENFAA